jgi:hypothetical protein
VAAEDVIFDELIGQFERHAQGAEPTRRDAFLASQLIVPDRLGDNMGEVAIALAQDGAKSETARRRLRLGEERGQLRAQIVVQPLVAVEVEDPVAARLVLCETLLRTEADPGVADHAGVEPLGESDRVVRRIGIDNQDLVDQTGHRA